MYKSVTDIKTGLSIKTLTNKKSQFVSIPTWRGTRTVPGQL